MSDIVLTSGVRSNLLQLQKTADLITNTQTKLATGKRVNSALDNPINFFTAQGLTNRASDLGNLLDSMSSGISTIQAANLPAPPSAKASNTAVTNSSGAPSSVRRRAIAASRSRDRSATIEPIKAD